LLFVPFLELKDRIGIIKAQNDNIGLGLSCSKEICKKLGGDLKLKQSEKGMTIFGFKIPVTLQETPDSFSADEQVEIDISNSSKGRKL
jgi:K+-sensing histidine kinase KdpD